MRTFAKWKSAILFVLVLGVSASLQGQKKPNILVIWGDDVGY
jgi:hypothetical protein